MSKYQCELGQGAFGAPSGEFDIPPEGKALTLALIEEIKRVYWNRHQKEWGSLMPDPNISGLAVRCYDWSGESEFPNFAFNGVEIRWYKYPGRGMSCNVEMDGNGWCAWFRQCLDAILKSEKDEQ